MSLFWRIMTAFVIAVGVTFLSQRLISLGESGLPTLPKFTIARSELVKHLGDIAAADIGQGSSDAALSELAPIESSGIRAWLVTPGGVVGRASLSHGGILSARNFLSRREQTAFSYPYQLRLVGMGKDAAVLVLEIPGLTSPLNLAARLIFLIGIPVCIGLWMAKRLSSPMERIGQAALRFSNGDLSYRVGSIAGPREIQDLGRTFDKMASQVQDTLESQKRLLADVSHEVRSPLGRLKMASSMLSENKGDVQINIERISRDVKRLDELIGMLSLVNLPLPSIDLGDEVDLGSLLEEILVNVSVEAAAKQINIEVSKSPTRILGNRPLLYSAFENLIRNAILHSGPGSLIEIKLTEDPPILMVQDRGPGVPNDELAKIFQPFYRSSQARERETGGVGLGLAIVKRAAEAHRGRAWVEPRAGGGLVAIIEFESAGTAKIENSACNNS